MQDLELQVKPGSGKKCEERTWVIKKTNHFQSHRGPRVEAYDFTTWIQNHTHVSTKRLHASERSLETNVCMLETTEAASEGIEFGLQ